MNRKDFIKNSSLLLGGVLLSARTPLSHIQVPQKSLHLKKALGYDMIKDDLSILDKFKLVRDLGFDGIEINTPSALNLKELESAVVKTGIKIPSTVNKDHWSKPLSTSDLAVRKEIIKSISESMEQTKYLGGDTVLVVPGVVNSTMPYQTAYFNSLEAIQELIPYAEKYNIKIGLENVWNNFLLSPVEANDFLEQINHPLVGWYFDIGNVMRYGWPEHWVEALGPKIFKLHAKEFSLGKMNNEGLRKGFNVDLGQGDINWPLVMEKLKAIDYQGEWITLEVGGGDNDYLRKLSEQLDKVIN